MIKELKRGEGAAAIWAGEGGARRDLAFAPITVTTSSPDFESSVDDAHNAAPGISLNFVDIKKMKAPQRTALHSCPANRPVIIVDDGTSLTPALAARIGAERPVVVLSHQDARSNGLRSDVPRFIISDRSEATLQKALKDIESRSGVPSSFVFQFVESESYSEQLGWALMAAKHLSPALQ